MTALILAFLRNRVAANLLMVALLLGGISAAMNLTVRTFPEIATTAITVTIAYPGATPSEVADAILTAVEEELQGLEGVLELSATATRGTGTVTTDLDRGAEAGEVKDDIETRLARIATFPEAARSPRVAEAERTELAIQLALYGDVPRATLKALAESVRDDLTDMAGISQVAIDNAPGDGVITPTFGKAQI